MPTAADLSQQVRNALALSEPDLDTSVGSIAGKIIDALTPRIAEQVLDEHLTDYQFDIDSMTAGTLEGFVRLFGMNRRPATFAIGTVTFTRSATAASKTVASIPVGTQIMAATAPVIYVRTIAGAVMALGQTSIDVPVQAVVAGSAGNVPAGSLTTLVSDVGGVSSVTNNTDPLTGGADAENDDTLRARWRSDHFRNLAGTMQMFRAASAQAHPSITKVNVLGAKKTWVDRITITNGTSGPISFGNPAYIYPAGILVGANIAADDLLNRVLDYTVTLNNTSITINAATGGQMVDGDYDVQYMYVPAYSRNNPFGTRFGETAVVNNRIDIWVNGQDPVAVSQVLKKALGTTNGPAFQNGDANADYYTGNYSKPDGSHPAVGDIFVPLGFAPVLSVPDEISYNNQTYLRGTDYDLVHRSDAFGYAPHSDAGLVWKSAVADGGAYTINYTYNHIPTAAQRLLHRRWRLLGTDLEVHAGIQRYYRFHLAVMYVQGADVTATNTAIDAAISTLVTGLGFDSALQASDVLQAVHNVSGVDNVRFLNSGDDPNHYAIELINPDGSASGTISQINGRASDLYFDDATYPAFYDTRLVTKTRSSFGAA